MRSWIEKAQGAAREILDLQILQGTAANGGMQERNGSTREDNNARAAKLLTRQWLLVKKTAVAELFARLQECHQSNRRVGRFFEARLPQRAHVIRR